MNSNWNHQDIIDLEYFFRQDEECAGPALHARDRQIYLDHAGSQEQEQVPVPRILLAIWLAARRTAHGSDAALPGTLAQETHALLRVISVLSGLFSGSSAGLVFFSYVGATPVNVLHFLVLFVGSQLLLAVGLLARATLAGLVPRLIPSSLAIRAMTALSARLVRILHRQAGRHLSAEQRLAAEAFHGRVKAANSSSSLLFWPIFQLIQLMAVCFNLGLLAATFFKISTSDLAFGWQSTLQFSGQTLHSLVRWLSLPWSWLLPEGTGYPTLAQIEGSRIILKEGIANLQTPDLVSWWPFLLLSVLVYGLLLRLALYAFGRFRQQQAAAPQFTTAAARQVLRRMQTPIVSSQARPEPATQPAGKETEPQAETAPQEAAAPGEPVILLLPDEIFELCSQKSLTEILAREGYRIAETRRFMTDYESDRLLPAELGRQLVNGCAGIVILMEAWMPPLVSFHTFIKELRQNIGTDLPVMVKLVGKPAADSALTPVRDTTLSRVWRQKMAALGDANLTTAELIEEESA